MDVERTIDSILRLQARSDQRIDALIRLAGMHHNNIETLTMDVRALTKAQRETDRQLKTLIRLFQDSLRRGRNGARSK